MSGCAFIILRSVPKSKNAIQAELIDAYFDVHVYHCYNIYIYIYIYIYTHTHYHTTHSHNTPREVGSLVLVGQGFPSHTPGEVIVTVQEYSPAEEISTEGMVAMLI